VTVVGQAVCSLLLAVQGLLGHAPVPVVLALVAAQSGFGAVGGVFVPRLLPNEQVAAGLTLNQMSFQSMMLVGPLSAACCSGGPVSPAATSPTP
jgi:hypothetical protein